MQPESVKCECLHMFPITAPGQRAPLTQQEPPKLSQATGLKAISIGRAPSRTLGEYWLWLREGSTSAQEPV